MGIYGLEADFSVLVNELNYDLNRRAKIVSALVAYRAVDSRPAIIEERWGWLGVWDSAVAGHKITTLGEARSEVRALRAMPEFEGCEFRICIEIDGAFLPE